MALTPAARALPWASTHPRHFLVGAAWGPGGGSQGAIHALRVRLREMCEAAPGTCEFVAPSSGRIAPSKDRASHDAGDFEARAAAVYWNSTFCLQPGGDDCTRKAIFDALLLGCIPVRSRGHSMLRVAGPSLARR